MKKKSKEGIILIYVLGFTLAITTLLLVVHYKVEKFMDEFTNKIEFEQMENLAESGYSIGINLLKNDQNSYDWYGESWAKDIEIDAEKYKIKVKIIDEDGKININKVIGEKGEVNTLLMQILKGVFTISGYSDSMVDCLLDWIDEDELPRSSGAESTFYKMSGYPYVPPNRPLYSIEEITLIKDFNKKIVYGENKEEKEEEEMDNEENNNIEVKKGLINFISTISDDKININTCEWEILSGMGYTEANIDQTMDQRDRSPLSESYLLGVNKEVTLNNKRIIKYKSFNFAINVLVESSDESGENKKIVNFKFFVYKDGKGDVKLIRKEKIWENSIFM